ncbi:MAG TPA: SRPBCC family protein, partial [Gemmatimonadaceae bacterium]|nr:SRPBCC family protein [Gemmatimonadaceae bacterium]
MPAMAEQKTEAVRKSITVNASPDVAFEIFTADFDSWWPRSHHLGQTPMTRGIIEGRQGGRCYTEHEDGSEVDWGTVLIWEPPRRLVFSWQIAAGWKCEPDISKASEVEVRFTSQAHGKTRLDLEHRYFERMA